MYRPPKAAPRAFVRRVRTSGGTVQHAGRRVGRPLWIAPRADAADRQEPGGFRAGRPSDPHWMPQQRITLGMLQKVFSDSPRVCIGNRNPAAPGDRAMRILHRVTEREREVLRLLARAQSNQQIARSLGISIHGVKRHVSNLLLEIRLLEPDRTRPGGVPALGRSGAPAGSGRTDRCDRPLSRRRFPVRRGVLRAAPHPPGRASLLEQRLLLALPLPPQPPVPCPHHHGAVAAAVAPRAAGTIQPRSRT